MSAAGEDVAPAVQKPVEEVKAPKEKKPKAPKQAKTASHPPYFEMIKEALVALNEKGGSSPYAIAKYVEEKHKAVLPANFKKILGLQLKNQAARGKLVKIKASYKLSEIAKKENTVKATKSTVENKASRPKRSRTETVAAKKSKKSETVKKAAKKAGPKKTKKVTTPTKPKQPKSIRTPSKRARKATVATA